VALTGGYRSLQLAPRTFTFFLLKIPRFIQEFFQGEKRRTSSVLVLFQSFLSFFSFSFPLSLCVVWTLCFVSGLDPFALVFFFAEKEPPPISRTIKF